MSDSDPWWFSGPPSAPASEGTRERSGGGGFSLSFLASGAQQVVEMAKQAILVPHADHEDPSEHGECIVCRGLLALDEVRGRPNAGNGDGPGSTRRGGPVRWIDLDQEQIDLDQEQSDAPLTGEETDRRLST